MSIFNRKPRPKPRRTGLVTAEFTGTGWSNKGVAYKADIEVGEWECLGDKSRVTILSVSGIPRNLEGQARELLGKWVHTSAVTWRSDVPK